MKREQLNLKIPVLWTWDMWFRVGYLQVALGSNWLLRQPAVKGNSPVMILADSCNSDRTESRVTWDCSTKWEVYSF